MTEIKIDLTEAIEKTTRDAKGMLASRLENTADRIINAFLNDGKRVMWSSGEVKSGEEGLAHEIIRKQIEEYILSDEYAEMVAKAIRESMSEQAASAVGTFLNSRIRKNLFQPTSPNPAEIDTEEENRVATGSSTAYLDALEEERQREAFEIEQLTKGD